MKLFELKQKLHANTQLRIAFPDNINFNKIKIASSCFYSIIYDEKFVQFGPYRSSNYFLNINELKLNGNSNKLVIRFLDYGVSSLDIENREFIVGIELLYNNKVVATTKDFNFLIDNTYVSETNKYSFQRGFIERFDLTKNPLGNKVELIENKSAKLNEIKTDKCAYKTAYPTVVYQGPFNGFDEIKTFSYVDKYNDKFNLAEVYKYLAKNHQCFHYKFENIVSGIIHCEIESEVEQTIYLVFNECLVDGKWIISRSSCNELLEIKLKKGKNTIFSNVPYTFMHLMLLHKEQISNVKVDLVAIQNDTTKEHFTDNDDINLILDATKRTFDQNAVDLFTDCPGRERGGYLCDAFFTGYAERFYTGKHDIEKAFLENFALQNSPELPDGILPMCFPAVHEDNFFIPQWSLWFIVEVQRYFNETNDIKLVKKLKAKIYGVLSYFKKFENEKGLLENLESWSFLEWSDLSNDDRIKPISFATNMLYKGAIDAASILYNDQKLRSKSENLTKEINNLAFNGEYFVDSAKRIDGKITPNNSLLSETTQYFAYFFNVRNDTEFFNKICIAPKNEKLCPSAVFIGKFLRLLCLYGQKQYQLILDEFVPYFLKMAKQTGTLWEKDQPSASCNHGFASILGPIIYDCYNKINNPNIYSFEGKTKNANEGLMIGNGFLGSLIYGNDNLEFSLDRIDLWDTRLPEEFADKNFNYPYLVKCLNENFEEAYKLFDKCYCHSYPTKLNAGILRFDYKVKDSDKFLIKFKKAKAYFSSKEFSFNSYVDANKNVIVINLDKDVKFSIDTPAYFYKKLDDGGLDYKKPKTIKDGKFEFLVQEYGEKESYGIGIYKSDLSLYITVFKGKNLTNVKKSLINYSLHKNENYKKHLDYWNNYYSKSSIVTPDKKVNDLFLKGQYFFGSNSRKDYPMTLQGVWTQNDGFLPKWKSDIHNDINVQMTYDGYMKLGHFEEGRVLVDFFWKNRGKFKKVAKNFMLSDGLLIPGVMSQQCVPLGGWPQYSMNPGCSIWILKPFDDLYRYTKTKDSLKKAYYFFSETEKCIFKYLKINKKGFYELGFHTSPEFFDDDKKSLFKTQSNFELTMLKYLYSKLIEYSTYLNKNKEHYEEVYSKIADFWVDENGYLKISDDQKYEKSHRHFSHMLMYKNLDLVEPFENIEKIKNDVKHLESFGYSEWVGFACVECGGLHAYAFEGNEAYKNISDFIKYFCHKNGFHVNCDYLKQGFNDFGPYVLTLEANVGFLRTLSDMMLYTHNEKIAIFPAIPDYFAEKGCKFENLVAQGNVHVSGFVKAKKLSFEIKANGKTSIKLFNNFENNPLLIVDGEKINKNSHIGEFIDIDFEDSVIYAK